MKHPQSLSRAVLHRAEGEKVRATYGAGAAVRFPIDDFKGQIWPPYLYGRPGNLTLSRKRVITLR